MFILFLVVVHVSSRLTSAPAASSSVFFFFNDTAATKIYPLSLPDALPISFAFLAYGLATEGWMMYVIIVCNLLAFAVGPAMQGIVSKATDPRQQGALMGSMQSLSSLAKIGRAHV